MYLVSQSFSTCTVCHVQQEGEVLEIYGFSGGDSLLAGDFSGGTLCVCVILECSWWLSMETTLQEGERCGEWEFQETEREGGREGRAKERARCGEWEFKETEREGGREGGKDGGRYVGRCKNGEK